MFYTNVWLHRGKIYTKGVREGKPFRETSAYSPYLFVNSPVETQYKTLDGKYVDKKNFNTIREARDFVKSYSDVSNFPIYGLTQYQYTYIFDNYKGMIEYDPELISVVGLDIENSMKNRVDIATGVTTTPNEITAITLRKGIHRYTFGVKEFTEHQDDLTYYHCKNEKDLLLKFIQVWKLLDPDVITGWNVEFYDIPYLVNRIIRVLGERHAKELSPWGNLIAYEVMIKGKLCPSYQLAGISVLDYMQLYKKFTYKSREKYTLAHICEVELGETKLDYTDYINLDDLYEKNPQKYIEYNIHDVDLIFKLEDKLKLIELVFALAYDAKVNYNDTLASVRQWDVMIHNYLLEDDIVIPNNRDSGLGGPLVGGYVKAPHVGMHKWVVSFDLNSLYPHLIMQYNISPETFAGRVSSFNTIDKLLERKIIRDDDHSWAANGCYYTKDKQGFLPALMEKMYEDRNKYKRLMFDVKQKNQKNPTWELQKLIAKFNNLQMAKKIQLNSAYGALGNKYFRWYDINHAEAITMSGQLSIRWIADRLNEYLNKLIGTENVDFVIASDTDSVYITLDRLVQKVGISDKSDLEITRILDKFCSEKMEVQIEKFYSELAIMMNAKSQKMKMARECIANKAIWTAKKRYILNVYNLEGVEYAIPELKMSGIEAIKSSTPQVCRTAIKHSISLIMSAEEKDLQQYVSKFRTEFENKNFAEISFPRGISDIAKWNTRTGFLKKTPIHVKGSILFNRLIEEHDIRNKYEEIGSGDKIRFCYLKAPNPHFSNVLSCPDELPEEFNIQKYINYDLQFTKSFLDPLLAILKSIGWEAEHTSNLDSFFGD